MKAKLEKLQRKLDNREKYLKKMKTFKEDYNDLLDQFAKSESIRKEQKEVISVLKSEVSRLKKKRKKRTSSISAKKGAGKRVAPSINHFNINSDVYYFHI